jgi:hypothetical protein
MDRSHCARGATLALTVWTQACTVYHHATGNAAIPVGRTVRVRSDVPFALAQPSAALVPVTFCHATAVEGDLVSVSGDTLLLARSRNVAAAPDPDGSSRGCPGNARVAIVRTAGLEVAEGRTDALRTAGFVLGVTGALTALFFVAFSRTGLGRPIPNAVH